MKALYFAYLSGLAHSVVYDMAVAHLSSKDIPLYRAQRQADCFMRLCVARAERSIAKQRLANKQRRLLRLSNALPPTF